MSLDLRVNALTATLKSEFWKAWDEVAPPAPWEDFTTVIPSTTKIENYINFTPVPGMTEWLGYRNYGQVDSFVYQVRNKTFQTGIQAELEDIQDDQTGGLMMKPKEMTRRAKLFPGRQVVKLLGKGFIGFGSGQSGQIGVLPPSASNGIALLDGQAAINAFDGLSFFGSRAVGSSGFGVGQNALTFTAGSGDGKVYNVAALYYGDSVLKPLAWQNRAGPDFETNSGTPQSKESRKVRWWVDLRGAPFWGYWWNAVWVQITNTPNVAEMHAVYSLIESAFRTFQLPKTISTEDGEYVHEQTIFGSDNLYLCGSTYLSEQMRQSMAQDWSPQNIGNSTVATTNNWKGWAKYMVSRFLDNF